MNESSLPDSERITPSEIEVTPELVQAVLHALQTQTVSVEYSRTGPVPTHEEMRGYKDVDPRLVETIMQIALDSSSYPESRDQKLSDRAKDLIRSFTGLGLGALVLAGYLAYLGHDVAALVTGIAPLGTGLITTVLSFIGRWWLQRRGEQR